MREIRERKLADGPSSVKVVNLHWQWCGWGSRPFQLFWEDGKTPWGKLRAPWDLPKGDLCLPVLWSAQSLREIWFKAYLAAVIHSSWMDRHESSCGFLIQRAMQYLNICHWWMCKFPCCHHHIQHGALCSSSQKNHLGPFCSRLQQRRGPWLRVRGWVPAVMGIWVSSCLMWILRVQAVWKLKLGIVVNLNSWGSERGTRRTLYIAVIGIQMLTKSEGNCRLNNWVIAVRADGAL